MKLYDPHEATLSGQHMLAALPGKPPEISVFLPVKDEEPNLRLLHDKLDQALRTLGRTAEIIYVDDGSTDDGLQILREWEVDRRVRVVALRRNCGPTAGSRTDATRNILIPMDADHQTIRRTLRL
jgi:glycosyltransferase involved in cell wall biosynthesis